MKEVTIFAMSLVFLASGCGKKSQSSVLPIKDFSRQQDEPPTQAVPGSELPQEQAASTASSKKEVLVPPAIQTPASREAARRAAMEQMLQDRKSSRP